MNGMMSDWSGWSWSMIFFWTLIVIGIVAVAKWLSSSTGLGDSGKRPLTILQERYARGEITRDEYERMRQDLVV